MSSVLVVFVGLFLVYSGLTNRIDGLIAALRDPAPGYTDIPPVAFLIGMGGVSLPMLSMRARPDWINGYILLIILATALANYGSLERFVKYIQSEV